jgi:hypothetical protein
MLIVVVQEVQDGLIGVQIKTITEVGVHNLLKDVSYVQEFIVEKV